MVDQEKISAVDTSEPPPSGKAKGGVDEILHHLISLAELQVELFRLALRDGVVRVVLAGAFLASAMAASIATFCVALILVAEILVETVALARGTAFIAAAALGVTLAVGLLVAAKSYLRSSLRVFDRSRAEWSRTIGWLKATLNRPLSRNTRDNNE
jgi:hypothetical protein